ncbi:MAG: DNA-directed RNA polymerase subunit RpoH/Rpb5 C-terminal domain-containing protein [Candidatus Pacearchaeota archaeon]
MHTLQPKQTKLKSEEADKLLVTLNISLAQLPKVKITDPTLPENCNISDIIKVERASEDGKPAIYYRVVAL